MASFRRKFEAGLVKRGIEISHDAGEPSDAILVIAGTKNLLPLWKATAGGKANRPTTGRNQLDPTPTQDWTATFPAG